MQPKRKGKRYIPYTPRTVPPGRIVVHNHATPHELVGADGFRVWLDDPSPDYERCPCPWAPHLAEHYKVAGMPHHDRVLAVSARG